MAKNSYFHWFQIYICNIHIPVCMLHARGVWPAFYHRQKLHPMNQTVGCFLGRKSPRTCFPKITERI